MKGVKGEKDRHDYYTVYLSGACPAAESLWPSDAESGWFIGKVGATFGKGQGPKCFDFSH